MPGPRLPPVPLQALPPELLAAVQRGRASGLLSTTVPAQVWAHRPAVALAWLQALEAMHGANSLLPERLRELMRLQIAAITTCQACQLARKSETVTAEDLACLSPDDPRFSPAEQAGLRYAQLFAQDPMAIDDALFERLALHFSVPQVAEINLYCALMLAGGRMTLVQQAYGTAPA